MNWEIWCNLELRRNLKSHKSLIPMPSSSDWNLYFNLYAQGNTEIKKSVPTLISKVASIGIRDNNIIYITPRMTLYEDVKPIAHVLLHRICVVSHLICACKHCNIELSSYDWTHWSYCPDEYITSKTRLIFMIKPRHPGRLKKHILMEKTRSGSPGQMQKNACYCNLKWTFEDLLPCYCYAIKINTGTTS